MRSHSLTLRHLRRVTQVLAGEDWQRLLYEACDSERVGGWGWPLVFYLSWVVIGQVMRVRWIDTERVRHWRVL